MKKQLKTFSFLSILFLLVLLIAFPFSQGESAKAQTTKSNFQPVMVTTFVRNEMLDDDDYIGSCDYNFLIHEALFDGEHNEYGVFYTFKDLLEDNNITSNYYEECQKANVKCGLLADDTIPTSPTIFEDYYVETFSFHFTYSKLESFGVDTGAELFVCVYTKPIGASDSEIVYSEPLIASVYGQASSEKPTPELPDVGGDSSELPEDNDSQKEPAPNKTEDKGFLDSLPNEAIIIGGIVILVLVICFAYWMTSRKEKK